MIRKKLVFILIVILLVILLTFKPFLGKKFVNSKIDKNSIWYVNDLYMSNQYYYNHILNDSQKVLYAQLFNAINNLQEEITVKYDNNDVIVVIDAIQLDHPEMINFTTFSYSYNDSSSTTIFPKYLTTSKFKLNRMISQVQQTITKLEKKTRGKSEYEKELYIYNLLGDISRYRRDSFNYSDQSAYTSLVKSKNTVCAGFGKGAQILFQNVDIESYLLLSDNHIWNLVNIENDYYYFDATNTYVPNCYNTVSHSGLNTTFYNDPRYGEKYQSMLPTPNGLKYNYYEYTGLLVNEFNDLNKIVEMTNKNAEFIEFKLTGNISAVDFFNIIRTNLEKSKELGIKSTGGIYYDNVLIVKKEK